MFNIRGRWGLYKRWPRLCSGYSTSNHQFFILDQLIRGWSWEVVLTVCHPSYPFRNVVDCKLLAYLNITRRLHNIKYILQTFSRIEHNPLTLSVRFLVRNREEIIKWNFLFYSFPTEQRNDFAGVYLFLAYDVHTFHFFLGGSYFSFYIYFL